MTRLIPLLVAAIACAGVAVAQIPAAKAPAAKAPSAKASAPKAAPPAAAYDAQDPQSLIGLLTAVGAQAQTGRKDEDSVFVAVKSPAANFSIQFAGCDRQGRSCQAALFDNPMDARSPTLVQINAFNQASVTCRAYVDTGNKPHVLYSAVLMRSDSREAARTHLAAWQGCIVEGRNFVADPAGFLANAA